MFLGCSGTTWLGGKLVFFISCRGLGAARWLFTQKKSNKLLRRRRIALCSRDTASGGMRTPFFGSPPQSDTKRRDAVRDMSESMLVSP